MAFGVNAQDLGLCDVGSEDALVEFLLELLQFVEVLACLWLLLSKFPYFYLRISTS